MSDIHGMYEKYLKMLEIIRFSDDDDLYILGDVIDHGEQSVELMFDIMERPNVFPLYGNHELMAQQVLDVMFNGENNDQPAPVEDMIFDWTKNGGAATLESISQLSYSDRLRVLDYFTDLVKYSVCEIDDKTYYMVHAGFDNFSPQRSISDYSIDELVWHTPDSGYRYFDDKDTCVIAGHKPTLNINGHPDIIHKNGNILIDCGAFIEGGRLACLCLDNMKEFYV